MHLSALALLFTCLAGRPVGATLAPDSLPLRPVRYDLDVRLDLDRQRMSATARIHLRNDATWPVRGVSLLLYRLLAVRAVRDAAGAPRTFRQRVVAFEDMGKLQVNHIEVPLDQALAPGQETTLELEYEGYLLGYRETGMLYVQDHIDTTYTILREDAYAYPQPGYPSQATNRRAGLPTYSYTARITVPASYTVANGGELVTRTVSGATVSYVYKSLKPSWRMDFAVARFTKLTEGNLTVFRLPADSTGARRIVRTMSRTLQLYARWFGPLRGTAPFTVIEIPDGWGSQADITSILQAAAAFQDARRESELYHELSHLWNAASGEAPAPRWDEGLASFLEDVTADSMTGTATTDSSAMRVARWLAIRFAADSTLRSTPMADFGKREMTGYSYWVGSVMFHGLYRVVGHEKFGRIIGEYYRRYEAGGGSSVAFVRTAQEVSKMDLTAFFNDWLFTTRWGAVVANAKQPADLYQRYRH
jgi:hypothetical protein